LRAERNHQPDVATLSAPERRITLLAGTGPTLGRDVAGLLNPCRQQIRVVVLEGQAHGAVAAAPEALAGVILDALACETR
jgi:hypothetical protein